MRPEQFVWMPRSREIGVPEVYKQYDARLAPPIPYLVLPRVVENQTFSLIPLSRLGTNTDLATVRDFHTQMTCEAHVGWGCTPSSKANMCASMVAAA